MFYYASIYKRLPGTALEATGNALVKVQAIVKINLVSLTLETDVNSRNRRESFHSIFSLIATFIEITSYPFDNFFNFSKQDTRNFSKSNILMAP